MEWALQTHHKGLLRLVLQQLAGAGRQAERLELSCMCLQSDGGLPRQVSPAQRMEQGRRGWGWGLNGAGGDGMGETRWGGRIEPEGGGIGSRGAL